MTKDFTELLKAAKLPERTVDLCLNGDLQAEIEDLLRELRDAEQARAKNDSLDGGADVARIKERIEDLRQQMLDHTYTFRLRALPRRQFNDLVNAHPPRQQDDGEVDPVDAEVGFNNDTFAHAMVRACVTDPVLDDEQWADLYDNKLTDYQAHQLQGAAWLLNRRRVDVPLSPGGSPPTGDSASE